jgi:hypothetical protein
LEPLAARPGPLTRPRRTIAVRLAEDDWEMAQPLTVSETRFAEYLIVHGYEPERDVDWRLNFGVDAQGSRLPRFARRRGSRDLRGQGIHGHPA